MPAFTTNKNSQTINRTKTTIRWNQSPSNSTSTGFGLQLKDGLEKLQVSNAKLPSGWAWSLIFIGGIAAVSLIHGLLRLTQSLYCSGTLLATSLVSTIAVGIMAGAAVLLVMGIKLLAEQ